MGISELAVHNVLRTYSRQEGIGRAQKSRPNAGSSAPSADQVTLSGAARKAQWLGQFSAEVVDARQQTLSAEERATLIRGSKDELLGRHEREVRDDALTAEEFESRLRQLYRS